MKINSFLSLLVWAGRLSGGLFAAADSGHCKRCAVPWLVEHRCIYCDCRGYFPHDRLCCWFHHFYYNAAVMAKVREFLTV